MGKEQEFINAVKNQDVMTIAKLLSKLKASKNKLIGSNKKLNVNHQDSDGMCGLHQAALVGNTDIMYMLLGAHCAVDLSDAKGMRPLHYACWQGRLEPVTVLLQWGADPNAQASRLETPVHLACQHGHYDVANQLLMKGGDIRLRNAETKTAMDLACEYGRYRLVELLLHSRDREVLIKEPDDVSDPQRTTPLHLAARNGHVDIIKLLLQMGASINALTARGTCLHEASRNGHLETVKFLVECGIDVNKVNANEQTALDIVHKFVTSRVGVDIKRVLTEAGDATVARANTNYCDIYDPNTIAFKEGDYINVLEQRQGEMWKGHVMREGQPVKAGLFPSKNVTLVPLNMVTRGGRATSIPDVIHRDMPGQTFGTVGADRDFPPPPSPLVTPKSPSKASDSDRDSGISPQQHHPPHPFPCNQTSPISPAGSGSSDWLNNGHRASPSGSNRSSAASSGSGSYLAGYGYINVHVNNNNAQHRLSNHSNESGVSTSSRQSYHSASSSSLGSLDKLEAEASSNINVHELLQQGYSDPDILHAWLVDLHFEEYLPLFRQAGYDMPTISRMTPEDLTAIGITIPSHRKRLKMHISRLHIHDGIPNFKPNDVYDWLRLLRLEEYAHALHTQSYHGIDDVLDITWEDLEEIGIRRLGHQKKIMLAIDKLKRINQQEKRSSTLERRGSRDALDQKGLSRPQWIDQRPPAYPATTHNASSHHAPVEMMSVNKPKKSLSGENLHQLNTAAGGAGSSSELRTFSQTESKVGEIIHCSHQRNARTAGHYAPDVVAIQVHRSLSGSAQAVNRSNPNLLSGNSASSEHEKVSSFHGPLRSRDQDGDATPTRGSTPSDDHERYSTLGRRPAAKVSPRISPLPKPKPVAKVAAKLSETRGHGVDKETDILGPDKPEDNVDMPQSMATISPLSVEKMQDKLNYDKSEKLIEKVAEKELEARAKGKPPPPPKRTNSIKAAELLSREKPGYAVTGPRFASPSRQGPAVAPKPVTPPTVSHPVTSSGISKAVETPPRTWQQQAAAPSCVKPSASTDSLPPPPPPEATQPYSPTPSSEDEFPLPPPSPLTTAAAASDDNTDSAYCSGAGLQQGQDSALSDVIQQLERGPTQVDQLRGESDSDSSDSGQENRHHGRLSSFDSASSETLPFAQENCGTIKQRPPAPKPTIVCVSDDEGERHLSVNTGFYSDDGGGTMRRKPPLTPPKPSRADSASPKRVPPPTPPKTPQQQKLTQQAQAQSGDVLNDIGSMLQDLTDELDAMLEFQLEG